MATTAYPTPLLSDPITWAGFTYKRSLMILRDQLRYADFIRLPRLRPEKASAIFVLAAILVLTVCQGVATATYSSPTLAPQASDVLAPGTPEAQATPETSSRPQTPADPAPAPVEPAPAPPPEPPPPPPPVVAEIENLAGPVRPQTQAAANAVVNNVPGAKDIGIGGTRTEGVVDQEGHPAGLGLDYMVLDDAALGDAIAQYHIDHWDELRVKYIIWQQRIITSPSEGWKPMVNRGNPTANHMDHPHVSYLK